MLMFPCMESIGGTLQAKGSRSPEVNPCPIYPSITPRRIGMLVVETDGGAGGPLHCPNYNKLHLMTMMVEMIIIIIVTTT